MNGFLFRDRTEAGKQLADRLLKYKQQHPIVLALPRGGVVLGLEAAKALQAPLDVTITRKIGAPGNPEFGVGAIAQGGVMVLDPASMAMLGLTRDDLQETINQETAEMERRLHLYRGNRHNPQVEGKTVIVVDDGLATGVTAQAAIESIKLGKPHKLILAVPVCSKDAANSLKPKVDDFICLHQPENFTAVGAWYREFRQLSDQEVTEALAKARQQIKIK